ncbi:MAG: hypothetical protein ABH840_02220 [Nanoarchaeota archaeon]
MNTVRLRIKHRPVNPKYHLDGKKIRTGYGDLWYIFVGFKKSDARKEYLLKRGKVLGVGKNKRGGRVMKELDRMIEDSDED